MTPHKIAQALKRSKNSLLFIAIAILAVIVTAEAALLGLGKLEERSLMVYAKKVVITCADSKYRPACYDEEIPRLMDKLSMEDAFRATKMVQDMDNSYRYCHVLGHKLSAKETAKDPSLWKDVVQRCPSGMCSNGCIHGAFQERFRRESLTDREIEELKPQFANICERRPGFSPTGIERASCYHALGHLLMYVTDADIDKSVSLCREISMNGGGDYSQLCFDGSFMQIFQPLEPDDFSLIEGKEVGREEAKTFCDNYQGSEKGSCWSESWPLFREKIFSNPKNLIDHCGYLSAGESDRCFNALMYVFTAQVGFDQEKIAAYCKAMPSAYRGNCFAQAASRMIETDYRNSLYSVDLCRVAATDDKDNLCFKELLKYSTYNFHAESEAFKSFCGAMPSPWKEQCFERGSTAVNR